MQSALSDEISWKTSDLFWGRQYLRSDDFSITIFLLLISAYTLWIDNAAMSKKKLDDGALFRQNLRPIWEKFTFILIY